MVIDSVCRRCKFDFGRSDFAFEDVCLFCDFPLDVLDDDVEDV